MINKDYQIYLVGGYVRDKLLNIESKDIDFCFVINRTNVNITISQGFQIMKEYLIEENFDIFLENLNMLTIRARFPKSDKFKKFYNLTADFVLARKEKYNNKSRHPCVEIGTLYDDLLRRDFTINSMAIDLDGNLIDLFNGQEDLKNKILKTSNKPLVTMLDDPLRVLRAIRFSITKEFNIDSELFDAISNQDVLDKLFNIISLDRIREELFKMFKYSTSESIKVLTKIDAKIPGFIDKLFKNNLWLKPTTEKII